MDLLSRTARFVVACAEGLCHTDVVTFARPTSQQGPVRDPRRCGPTPIAHDLAAWETAHAGAMAARTRGQVRRLVEALARHVGADNLAGISNDGVCAFLGAKQNGSLGRPCSGKSIATYQSYLHAFFQWAVQTERIRANPAEKLPRARWIRRKQRAFTPDEVARVCATAPFEHACMIRFLAVTGMRPLHAEALRIRNFDLDGDPPRVVYVDSKTRVEREAALDVATVLLLKRLFVGRDPQDQPFRRMHHEQFDALLDAAGVAKFDARGRPLGYAGLRRFGPTAAARLGLDVEALRLQLGHSKLETTMRHYNDADIHTQFGAASALAAAISENDVDNSRFDLTKRGPLVEDRGVTFANPPILDRAVPEPLAARRTSQLSGAEGPAPCGQEHESRPASAERRLSSMGAAGFEPAAPITVDVGPGLLGILHRLIDNAARQSGPAPEGADHAHPAHRQSHRQGRI